MLSCLRSHICGRRKFHIWNAKNVFDFFQKSFLLPGRRFAATTYVSLFKIDMRLCYVMRLLDIKTILKGIPEGCEYSHSGLTWSSQLQGILHLVQLREIPLPFRIRPIFHCYYQIQFQPLPSQSLSLFTSLQISKPRVDPSKMAANVFIF